MCVCVCVCDSHPPTPSSVIIPRLASIAQRNNSTSNITKRRDVAEGLLEAYRSIAGCFISVDLLTSSLLPGLECLEKDVQELDPGKLVGGVCVCVCECVCVCVTAPLLHTVHSNPADWKLQL